MSRWLLLICSVLFIGFVTDERSGRTPGAEPLGGACLTDRDCQLELECTIDPGVIEGQCSASCNADAQCQDRFGTLSMCLGADLCARSCDASQPCPDGTRCNNYGWCER